MEAKAIDKDILVQLFYEHFILKDITRKKDIEINPKIMATYFIKAEQIVNELLGEE